MKKMKIAGLVVLVLLSVYLWRENRGLDQTFYRVKDSRIQKKIKICHLSDFQNRGDKKFQEIKESSEKQNDEIKEMINRLSEKVDTDNKKIYDYLINFKNDK